MEEISAHQVLAPAAGLQAIQLLDPHHQWHNHLSLDPYTSAVLYSEHILVSISNYSAHKQDR